MKLGHESASGPLQLICDLISSKIREGEIMNIRVLALAAAALTVLMGASLSAQSQQQGETPQSQTHKQEKRADRGTMMECHENMQSIRQSNDKLKTTIETAKQSNDPAKMRAALEDAESSIDSMNSHMDKCMSMMQDMHRKGMRDHEHMKGMSDEQKKPPTTATPK
jgi:predicted RNase H-like nuclease (RuvC/YqgF family)